MPNQETLKQQGNDSFKEQKYEEAINFYTQAIACDPNIEACGAVYSNRAACFQALGRFQEALQDADDCIRVRPDWFKGHHRKGLALEALNILDKADAAFQNALKLDPGNTEVRKCYNELVDKGKRQASGLLDQLFSWVMENKPGEIRRLLDANDDLAKSLLQLRYENAGHELLLHACATGSYDLVKVIMDKILTFNDNEYAKKRLFATDATRQVRLFDFACLKDVRISSLILDAGEKIGGQEFVKELLFGRHEGISPMSRVVSEMSSLDAIKLLISTCERVGSDLELLLELKGPNAENKLFFLAFCCKAAPGVVEYLLKTLPPALVRRLLESSDPKGKSAIAMSLIYPTANEKTAQVLIDASLKLGGDDFLMDRFKSRAVEGSSTFLILCQEAVNPLAVEVALKTIADLDHRHSGFQKELFSIKNSGGKAALELLLGNQSLSSESRDLFLDALVEAGVFKGQLDEIRPDHISRLSSSARLSLTKRQQFGWLTSLARRHGVTLTSKIIEIFTVNEVDPSTFFLLDEEGMKEMALPVTHRIRLRHIINAEKDRQGRDRDSAARELPWLDRLCTKHSLAPFDNSDQKILSDNKVDIESFFLLSVDDFKDMKIKIGPMRKMLELMQREQLSIGQRMANNNQHQEQQHHVSISERGGEGKNQQPVPETNQHQPIFAQPHYQQQEQYEHQHDGSQYQRPNSTSMAIHPVAPNSTTIGGGGGASNAPSVVESSTYTNFSD